MQEKLKSISSVCYALLLVSAVLHIAYGFEFLNLGTFRNKATGNQQLYDNAVPLATFTITFGIFLTVSALGCWYCRARMHHIERRGETFLWVLHWIIAAFTFAAGVMAVRQYSREVQFSYIFGGFLPSNSQFQSPLYLGLADGIYTFAVGVPVALTLVYFGNMKLMQISRKNMLDIEASDRPEESSVEEEPPLSATVSKHLTKIMGFEESREIQKALVE